MVLNIDWIMLFFYTYFFLVLGYVFYLLPNVMDIYRISSFPRPIFYYLRSYPLLVRSAMRAGSWRLSAMAQSYALDNNSMTRKVGVKIDGRVGGAYQGCVDVIWLIRRVRG